MSAGFLQLVLREDTSTDAVTWFYNALKNELPQARRLAINAIIQILYLVKLQARNAVHGAHHKTEVPIPNPATEDFVTAFRTKLAEPITEANENTNHYVDDLSLGWYDWPSSYSVNLPNVEIPRGSGFGVGHLHDVLTSQDFWKNFCGFLAQESTGTTQTPFNFLTAQFFKGVFKHFGDEFVEPLLPHLKALCEKASDRGSQRAAAEIVAGLLRGSKLWPLQKREKLGSLLSPLLVLAFETITSDTLGDWGAALVFALVIPPPPSCLPPLRLISFFLFLFSFSSSSLPEESTGPSEAPVAD